MKTKQIKDCRSIEITHRLSAETSDINSYTFFICVGNIFVCNRNTNSPSYRKACRHEDITMKRKALAFKLSSCGAEKMLNQSVLNNTEEKKCNSSFLKYRVMLTF